MKRWLWVQLAVYCITIGGHIAVAATAPQKPKLSIATRLDKTAMWVGDVIQYTVRVTHEPEIEFILDSVEKENFTLAPFVVRGMRVQRGDWAGGRKLFEITFDLSTYETGKLELTIPSFSLFYFARQGRFEQSDAQAETLQVPATKIALRSALGASPLELRDSGSVAGMVRWRWLAPLVLGLAAMLYLIAQSIRSAWSYFRHPRPARKRLSRQALDQWAQDNLTRIRGLSGDSPEEVVRFFSELTRFLRLYVAESFQIETAALTPEEIEAAVTQAGANGPFPSQLKSIFEQCELVQYGKDGGRLGAELKPRVLDIVGKVVKSPVS